MPASVRDGLKEAFQHEGALSSEEAEQMLTVMENSGRLQYDNWSWPESPISRPADDGVHFLTCPSCCFKLKCHTHHTVISNSIIVGKIQYTDDSQYSSLGQHWRVDETDEDAASCFKTTSRETKGSKYDVQALSKLIYSLIQVLMTSHTNVR